MSFSILPFDDNKCELRMFTQLLSSKGNIENDILKMQPMKVCLKCWDMDYQNMLHCLDIPPLSVRRRYLIV